MRPRVVWLNGPFGVGKSSVAKALACNRPRCWVFEPEWIGYVLKRLPASPARTRDFQDLPVWRRLTRWSVLILSRLLPGVLIVPMTMADPSVRADVMDAFCQSGVQVLEVVLTANRGHVAARMAARGAPDNNWGLRQYPRCVTGLQALIAQGNVIVMDTNDHDLADVVTRVHQYID